MAFWLAIVYIVTFSVGYCISVDDTFAYTNNFIVERLIVEMEAKMDAKIKSLETRMEKEISTLKEEFKKKERGYELIIETLQRKVSTAASIERELTTNNAIVNLTDHVLEDVYSKRKLKRSTKRRDLSFGANNRRRRNQVFSNNRRQISAAEENQVAFFASISKDQSHLGANQNIPFDYVVTNLRSAYNANRGIFTAPFAGTYLFCATLHASLGESWAHFKVNGEIIAKFHLKGVQSSQTVIVHLSKGDRVSIQNTALDKGLHGDLYSTFGGFLLYKDIPMGTQAIG